MRIQKAEAERVVEGAGSKPERIELLGAMLGRSTGEPVVIVGGSAIEVYAAGRTSSSVIDIVAPRVPAVEVIESWGFKHSGRVWRRADWNIDIDLLGEVLSGSRLKLQRRMTVYGPVYLLGVEDLLIKRLAELKHGYVSNREWRRDLQRQIRLLLSEYGNDLDASYLAFVARRDDVVDILADFRSHSARPRTSPKANKPVRERRNRNIS